MVFPRYFLDKTPAKPLTKVLGSNILFSLCGHGGTGRRVRLRGVWLTPSEFKSRWPHQQKAPDMLGCFSCSFRFLFVGAARRSALTLVSRFRFRGARSAAPPLTCRKPPLPRRHTVARARNIIPYVGMPCRVQYLRRSYCRDALPRQIAGRKRGIIAVPHPAMLPRKKLFVREFGGEKG